MNLSETDTIIKYLYALDDNPSVVKKHGSALIRMRNSWYEVSRKIGH